MKISVLDHGYVEFIEAWGHGKGGDTSNTPGEEDFEVGIIEAARQSTQGSFRDWERDSKLLSHLYKNKHLTPFEFSGMVIEVQAPIFVFREWQRHRTQSYNEMSARYAPLPDLYYTPHLQNILERGQAVTSNKQQTGTAPFDSSYPATWMGYVQDFYERAESLYQSALEKGIPKELARLVMPVGHYSRMRCSANLRNWLAFLTLRLDPAAQWEIRQFAQAVASIVAVKFPETWALFSGER